MAEHNSGGMDITQQEKTFASFIRFIVWAAAIIIVLVIFLALSNA